MKRSFAVAAASLAAALTLAACGGTPSESEAKDALKKGGLSEEMASCVAKGLAGDDDAMNAAADGKVTPKVQSVVTDCLKSGGK